MCTFFHISKGTSDAAPAQAGMCICLKCSRPHLPSMLQGALTWGMKVKHDLSGLGQAPTMVSQQVASHHKGHLPPTPQPHHLGWNTTLPWSDIPSVKSPADVTLTECNLNHELFRNFVISCCRAVMVCQLCLDHKGGDRGSAARWHSAASMN